MRKLWERILGYQEKIIFSDRTPVVQGKGEMARRACTLGRQLVNSGTVEKADVACVIGHELQYKFGDRGLSAARIGLEVVEKTIKLPLDTSIVQRETVGRYVPVGKRDRLTCVNIITRPGKGMSGGDKRRLAKFLRYLDE